MQKRFLLKSFSLAALALAVSAPAVAQQWKPTRPINLIVPWAAGGSTDQVTRVTAAELEKALGQTIVVVNARYGLKLTRAAGNVASVGVAEIGRRLARLALSSPIRTLAAPRWARRAT